MKKIILFLLIISVNTIIQAQKINFGIKAGLNESSISGSSNENTSSSTGFHAGVLLEFKALGKVAVQPELLFSTQGGKSVSKDLNISTTTKMNYVLVPIMIKYYTIGGLFIEAGPQVGFLTSATSEVVNNVSNTSNSSDLKEKTKAFDMAANVGVGYELFDKLVAQIRYSIGLTNTSKIDNTNVKNGVFQLSLGYKF